MDFYIIELYLSALSNVFVIWGQSELDDCFLTDDGGKILGFSSLADISNFMNDSRAETIPFDKKEFVSYKMLFLNDMASYSFKDIDRLLLRKTRMDEFEKDEYELLINAYNLISDYFFQIESEECLLLRENRNMQLFFDYYYYKNFWKQGSELIELQKEMFSFDYSEFAIIFKELIDFFVKSIKHIQVG